MCVRVCVIVCVCVCVCVYVCVCHKFNQNPRLKSKKWDTKTDILKEGLSVCLSVDMSVCVLLAPTVLDQSALNLAWILLWTLEITWGR